MLRLGLATVLAFFGCRVGESVTLEPAASVIDGPRVQVSGTTDLPDGAVLIYQLQHERWMNQPPTAQPQWIVEGSMSVSGGRFSATEDVMGWPSGRVEAWVGFQSGDSEQPAAVAERYGREGERLVGPNVKRAGAIQRVEASTTTTLN